MNLDVLKKLTNEALFKLQEGVKEEIESRIDYSVGVGKYGTFFDRRVGVQRRVRITKVNPKSVTAVETSDSYAPGENWRIGATLLKMEGVIRKERKIKPPKEEPKKMVTKSDNVW